MAFLKGGSIKSPTLEEIEKEDCVPMSLALPQLFSFFQVPFHTFSFHTHIYSPIALEPTHATGQSFLPRHDLINISPCCFIVIIRNGCVLFLCVALRSFSETILKVGRSKFL